MIARFSATPEQIEMIRDPAKIKVWVCGRRWGKTTAMMIYMATVALTVAGCKCWYVAPNYARALEMMRDMRKCKAFMGLVRSTNLQWPPRFELKNGSQICFRSADNEETLRGSKITLMCIDEAAILSANLFWNVLSPMTADAVGGTMLAGGTYAGRNWFYDLAEDGKGKKAEFKTWIYPTSTGIAFQDKQGKEALAFRKASTPPMVWQQEYECEPLSTIDAVFMYVDQCISQAPAQKPRQGRRYIVSQDIGRTHDPSSVVVLDYESGEICHAETYPLGMLHEKQAQRTKHLQQQFNNALIVLDTTGGASGGKSESHIKEYRRVIGDFREVTHNQTTKRNMINRLALDLETMKVVIPAEFKELIAQLKLYRYKIGEFSVNPQYGPSEGHDDLAAALYQATWAREMKWNYSSGNEYRGII